MIPEWPSLRGSIGTVARYGLPDEVDVVVVGSGAAGMMAALSAARAGATALVVEAEQVVGGTTAISGGAAWVPNHGLGTKSLKQPDDLERARRYILGEDRYQVLDPDIVEAFLDNAPRVARFVEENTYLTWIPVVWPDYHSDIEGASAGRALFPGPFPPEILGEQADLVRAPKKTGMAKNPLPLWMLNRIKGVWIMGRAMAGAFLEACLRNGVEVRVRARAVRLAADESGVHSVVIDAEGSEHTVRARKGVVLATGGFEGSDELTGKFLGAPFPLQVSPRGHDGAAVGLAEHVNADLTSMENAWWMPAVQVPGETMDDRPISRLVQGERALPHSIMVNQRGERFANEAISYNDLGQLMRQADPVTGEMPNATAWMIFDEHYRHHYGIFGSPPDAPLLSFVTQANTLEELADTCGIDPVGLRRTVERFNPEARLGRDPWFGRGTTQFERFFGDYHPRLGRNSPDARLPAATAKARATAAAAIGPALGPMLARLARARRPDRVRALVVPPLAAIMRPSLQSPPSSVLGPVDRPPYYAIKVESSAIGTVGGPRTDAHGRVLSTDGSAIPGLYAAGNAGGATTRGFYGGAGGTIVLGLVFGYLAGKDAAQR